jgi:hypothetical protein
LLSRHIIDDTTATYTTQNNELVVPNVFDVGLRNPLPVADHCDFWDVSILPLYIYNKIAMQRMRESTAYPRRVAELVGADFGADTCVCGCIC